MIALIPARRGSSRVPHKNRRDLGGRPLWRWTEYVALKSKLFDKVYVCTDDEHILNTALCRTFRRGVANDLQPDIDWIREFDPQDDFMILRPTSPFRTIEGLTAAKEAWDTTPEIWTSMRAMRRVTEHPQKMWKWRHGRMVPLGGNPTLAYQALPEVFVQTSSLEICSPDTIREYDNVMGPLVYGLEVPFWEGFSIDSEEDFQIAEWKAMHDYTQTLRGKVKA